MQRLLCATLVVIATFPLVHGQNAKRKFLPIVLDNWWNVDYVKGHPPSTHCVREV